jgi:SAM-dependent methyltransferase
MLKMYQNHEHSGSSAELWEENWQSAQFNQGLQFCRIDPLRPLFEKYAKEGTLMLEGGCGIGQYVTFYTMKGVKVVGLDFAQKALNQLRHRVSGLRLCARQIRHMFFINIPFRSKTENEMR